VSPLVHGTFCPGYRLTEVVVVDDGSTDDTAQILSRLGSRSGWRVVGSCGENLGKGNALKPGVGQAVGDIVLLTDVDLAVPLDEARKQFTELDVDVAVASRDLAPSDVTAPWGRIVFGRVFNLMVRRSTGLAVRDSQCGFKAMRTTLANSLLAEQAVPGSAYDVELLLTAGAGGHSMVEVAVHYVHEPGSKVHPWRHGPPMVVEVMRLAWRYWKPQVTARVGDAAHRTS
jgi:dolichyl-phosphate beta-glucosyltransferase